MLNKIKKILNALQKSSFQGCLELILHPFILPFMLITKWITSLRASKILLWGQWSRYHGFHSYNAINNLFYRTQWLNINRYGRLAKSPIIGLGDFPLSNWWHLSSLSCYFYSNAGAVTTLLGTLFMVFSNFIWLNSVDFLWVIKSL